MLAVRNNKCYPQADCYWGVKGPWNFNELVYTKNFPTLNILPELIHSQVHARLQKETFKKVRPGGTDPFNWFILVKVLFQSFPFSFMFASVIYSGNSLSAF